METKTTQENSEACAGLAAATGSAPTVESCLWMADTYCHPDSWANEFWRPHISVLASEVRRLRAVITETLNENLHLADGDNCTLIKLKRAVANASGEMPMEAKKNL